MYHPPRGGVRGGTDQFTWDTVKTDKHRENYLGHSVMAPVGRWQKGKDLSWYAKERKGQEDERPTQKTNELSAIKKAEEEAMLIALGLKPPKREGQAIPKEEVAEILKRNHDDRSSMNIERIGGVGIESGRAAMFTESGKHKHSDSEGVPFESRSSHKISDKTDDKNGVSKRSESETVSHPLKKHKKGKKSKTKKKKKHSSESEASDRWEDKIAKKAKHYTSGRSNANSSRKEGFSEKSESHSHSNVYVKSAYKHEDSGEDSYRRRHSKSENEYINKEKKYKKSKQKVSEERQKLSKRHHDYDDDSDDYSYKEKRDFLQNKRNDQKKENSNHGRSRRHDTSESD